MRVRCYWNLRLHCWSIQSLPTRRVIGHATKVLLSDVKFSVSEAGRQRVLREGSKNVHAFAVGTLIGAAWVDADHHAPMPWAASDEAYGKVARQRLGVEVTYNPRKHTSFVDLDLRGEVIGRRDEAPMAYLRRFDDRAVVLAFDPLQMTAEESARATR